MEKAKEKDESNKNKRFWDVSSGFHMNPLSHFLLNPSPPKK